MRFCTTVFFFVTHSIAAGVKRSSSEVMDDDMLSKSAHARSIDYLQEYGLFEAATDSALLNHVEKEALISALESEVTFSVDSRPDLVLKFILDNGWEFGNSRLVHAGNMMFFYNQIAASLDFAPKINAKGLLTLDEFEPESEDVDAIDSAVESLQGLYPFTMEEGDLANAISDDWKIVPFLMERTGPCLGELKQQHGSFTLSHALEIGIQLMEKLEMLHTVSHLLHGNIDPSRICQSLHNPSQYLLTDFKEAFIFDPESGAEKVLPGWNSSTKSQRRTRFSSVWELSRNNSYGPRDEVFRVLAIVLWLAQPMPSPIPQDGATEGLWMYWKTKIQFMEVLHLNRNLVQNEHKKALIKLHSGIVQSLLGMAPGERPPYEPLINAMHAIKHILDNAQL